MTTPQTLLRETSKLSNTFHYLIIDDSQIIRVQLARSIARVCYETGLNYRLYQLNRSGELLEATHYVMPPDAQAQPTVGPRYRVYVASSYKLALQIITNPVFKHLTVMCDLSVPGDTEVGLFGFLEAITQRQLPVNVVFISCDHQNRVAIEPLLEKGKAFFIEKGTVSWTMLPQALVQGVEHFNYQRLTYDDYTARSTLPAHNPAIIRPAYTPVFVGPEKSTVPAQPALGQVVDPPLDGSVTVVPLPATKHWWQSLWHRFGPVRVKHRLSKLFGLDKLAPTSRSKF